MELAAARPIHLTYCTNIHAGESWPEVLASLEQHLLPIRDAVAPGQRFGVGLRLSGAAARTLFEERAEVERLRAFLSEHSLYVFTINGFPYGAFHGTRVKENVYLPDWLDGERVEYSDRLAEVLAEILPPSMEGSISTVPGAFRARIGAQSEALIAENLLRHLVTLHRISERTGKRIALALEPEPACLLETTDDAIRFFEAHLFSRSGRERFGALSGLSPADAETFLRRHLGVCFDACHGSVEFEDPEVAIAKLEAHALRIVKFQISAGLKVDYSGDPERDRATAEALRPFAEEVYFHQVVERAESGLQHWVDLPEALAARVTRPGQWRIHFHVPIFRDRLGPFANTQEDLTKLLARIRRDPPSTHLEVETYCWDVLPEEHRAGGIVQAVARELKWAKERLST